MNSQLREHGFCLLRNILDKTSIQKILDDAISILEIQIKRHGIGGANFENNLIELFNINPEAIIHGGKQIQNLVSLYQLLVSEELLETLRTEAGLSDIIVNTKPVLFFHNKHLAKEEIYWKTPPHQDYASTQGSVNSVVIWTPLVNVFGDLGPLEVVPGSHRDGLQVSKYENSFGLVESYSDDLFVPVQCDVGDIILFSTFLVHRSGENRLEDKIRWSINFRYSDLMDKFWQQNNYFCPYIYKSQVTVPISPSREELAKYFG